MKTLIVLPALLGALLLGAAGCGKSEKAPPPPQIGGVTVDLPKLNAAFENSSQELKSTATQVGFNLRYGKYDESLMALDKLANDPNVTDAQKKVVAELIDQVKKLAGGGAAPTQ